MITEIGIVAGEIWQELDQAGPRTLDELSEKLNRPKEVILMSLGWLAREGHISLGNEETQYTANLSS